MGDTEVQNLDLPEVELASILSAHQSESDPYSYEFAYDSLRKFIEVSLDVYKVSYCTHIDLGLDIDPWFTNLLVGSAIDQWDCWFLIAYNMLIYPIYTAC